MAKTFSSKTFSSKTFSSKSFSTKSFDFPPVAYGQLFADDYQRGSLGSNYTSTIVTASIVANQLVTTNAGGTFNATVAYSGYGYTQLNSWTQTVDWIAPSVAALSFLGVGVIGKALSGTTAIQCGLLISAGGASSTVRIYRNGVLQDSVAGMAVVAGNVMRTTVAYNGATYTVTVNNITAGTSASITTTLATSGVGGGAIQGLGWFSLFPFQGIATVTNWTCTTNELKYADYAFVGDSITQVSSASSISNCFAILTGTAKNKTILKLAGSNNRTADIINNLPEIIAFRPKRVFLMIGGNDIAFGVATLTWQANYNAIIAALTAESIPITHLYATPRTPTNITPVNTFINGLGVAKIDTYTPLWSGTGTSANPIYYYTDEVHPNNAGHLLTSQTIVAVI